jgi:two-component system CheB/CheR fusion protein
MELKSSGSELETRSNCQGEGKLAKRKSPKNSALERSSRVTSAAAAGDKTKSSRKSAKTGDARDCVVVGIGASAGGLEAYKQFLRQMPEDSGLAFVLVQHLDPSHESLMVELLSKYTSMPVLQVNRSMTIEPDHVYMIPPNKFLSICGGELMLDEPVTRRGVRLPIDHFFRSLAEARKELAICVVLSGTGSDGAAGVQEVKAEGGLTIVQSPESAEHDGMPRAAIATGAVDIVVSIEEMATAILQYARHPYVRREPGAVPAEDAPDDFRAMLSVLESHLGHDFSRYKPGTITRRISRRMSIRQIRNPGDYLALLREDSIERQNLFKDLLIGVTRFFRDENAWEALAEVLTPLVRAKRDDEAFRVWVPGCATGEEAYSVAMLISELEQRQNRRLDIQVFATDIDRSSIDIARLGIYGESVTKDVLETQLDTFFQREGGRLRVRKKLRELCVFAVQNILSDPPFSGLDLVCCRNLLIYLESDVQRRIFELLHFALKPSGILFLGSSESPTKRKDLYEVISQQWRIYRKKGESKPGSGGIPMTSSKSEGPANSLLGTESHDVALIGLAELSKRALLEDFAPASVIVNRRGLIQYIHGPVHHYLYFPSGEPELDLCAMAHEGLKSKTRAALQQARSSNETIIVRAGRVQREGGYRSVTIRVRPIVTSKNTEPVYLVSFVDDESVSESIAPENGDGHITHSDDYSVSPDRELALELQATRDDLQSTIEELESANEELKASNEEVMSMNEELQSTNEELETSREELQSLNEELSTVNNQLYDKVEELENTTNDLSNLLTSTDLATVFLDSDLRIRRFTPATVRLMSLRETDVGRPLLDLAPAVDDPHLVTDAAEVLRHLMPVEREVRNGAGHAYMRRITPFRTSDNKIEGVVITFSDVTRLRMASERVEYRERQQAVIAQLGRIALAGDNLKSLFDQAAKAVAETLNVELCKILRLMPDGEQLRLVAGVGWRDGLVGDALVGGGMDSQAGYTLRTSSAVIVEDLRTEKRFSGPGLLTEHGVVSGLSVIVGPGDAPWGVLGAHTTERIAFTIDDTNFVQAVANMLWEAIERDRTQHRFRALVEASAQIVWTTNEAGEVVEDSPSWRYFTGQTYDEWKGAGWLDALYPEDRNRTQNAWKAAVAQGKPLEIDYRVRHTNGDWRWMEVRAIPLREFDGTTRGWVGMNTDITKFMLAQEHQSRLAAIIESSSDAIIGKTLDGTITSWNYGAEKLYGYTAQETIGKSIEIIIPEDRTEELHGILTRLRDGTSIDQYETVRRHKNGTMRDVSLTISPIRDASGKIIGASAIARDVTEQRKMEQELEDARVVAESANEAKSVFLANMSHEIRTPLTAILGYADLLQATLEDGDALACVRTIKDNGSYLCDILNDILDLSKIEAGKFEAHRQTCSVVEILADVRSLMAVPATEKSLTLSIEFKTQIPETIETDPKLVRQVLVNLVGNAVKFTDQGGVQLQVACNEAQQILEIAVIDSGVGIPDEMAHQLFEPFEQLDNSFTRAAGGSGLGLSISRRFAEMLGGTITVESEVGKGSTFRFTVATGSLNDATWLSPDTSILRKTDIDSGTPPLPRLSGKILAVDDRREIRFLVRRLVQSAGGDVVSVENGAEAIEAWRDGSEQGTPYDLILMDAQMPVMDGLDATRKLRAEGYRGPVIALTANAMQHDRERILSAGFDDFIAKPIDRSDLIRTLAKWLQKAEPSMQYAPGEGRMAILCVDDSPSICAIQKILLEKLGHEVRTAMSEAEALTTVAEFAPHVVLLDFGLPTMSGGELLKQLKTLPALASCVFVCLSGRAEHEIKWQEMGFNYFLQKPADFDDLRRILELVQREQE